MGRYVERINYWLEQASGELQTFKDIEQVRYIFNKFDELGLLQAYELEGEMGVIAYALNPDILGGFSLCELFMYIKPEHRGNLRLFKELIQHMEDKAKELKCSSVKIASNIGYNDDSVLKILKRWGYKTDTVIKKV